MNKETLSQYVERVMGCYEFHRPFKRFGENSIVQVDESVIKKLIALAYVDGHMQEVDKVLEQIEEEENHE